MKKRMTKKEIHSILREIKKKPLTYVEFECADWRKQRIESHYRGWWLKWANKDISYSKRQKLVDLLYNIQVVWYKLL